MANIWTYTITMHGRLLPAEVRALCAALGGPLEPKGAADARKRPAPEEAAPVPRLGKLLKLVKMANLPCYFD